LNPKSYLVAYGDCGINSIIISNDENILFSSCASYIGMSDISKNTKKFWNKNSLYKLKTTITSNIGIPIGISYNDKYLFVASSDISPINLIIFDLGILSSSNNLNKVAFYNNIDVVRAAMTKDNNYLLISFKNASTISIIDVTD
jgi:hypothetical protein